MSSAAARFCCFVQQCELKHLDCSLELPAPYSGHLCHPVGTIISAIQLCVAWMALIASEVDISENK
jgi:hypothetical protein